MSESITLTTYANMLPEDDSTQTFTVPRTWLEKHLKDVYSEEINEFLDNYTWDDSWNVLMSAENENMIIVTEDYNVKIIAEGFGFEVATWLYMNEFDHAKAVKMAVAKFHLLGFENITERDIIEVIEI